MVVERHESNFYGLKQEPPTAVPEDTTIVLNRERLLLGPLEDRVTQMRITSPHMAIVTTTGPYGEPPKVLIKDAINISETPSLLDRLTGRKVTYRWRE